MEVSGYYQYQRDEQGNEPQRSSTVRILGPGQRLLISVALLAGLLTFFLPAINFDPPVLQRSHWSLLDIVSGIQNGTLPEGITSFLPTILVLYLLILADLVGLFILRVLSTAASQALFAVVGAGIWLEARYSTVIDSKHELERFFYYGRTTRGHATFSYGNSLLLITILVILLITTTVRRQSYSD